MLFYFSRSDRVEWLLVDTWWQACKQLPLSIRNTVTLGPSSLAKFRFKISNFRPGIRNFASVQTKSLRNFALVSANFREVLEFSRSSPKIRRNFDWEITKFRPKFRRFFGWTIAEIRRNSFAFFLHSTVTRNSDSRYPKFVSINYSVPMLKLYQHLLLVTWHQEVWHKLNFQPPERWRNSVIEDSASFFTAPGHSVHIGMVPETWVS